jgi:translation elongation factor EF-4
MHGVLTRYVQYAGVFPVDSDDFPKLEEALKRLTLTDRSVTVSGESSTALGRGCRLGFLGTLHMDVFRQVCACCTFNVSQRSLPFHRD